MLVYVTQFCRLQALIGISGYFYLSTEKLQSHFSNLISQIIGKLPSVHCGYQPRTSKGLVASAGPNLKGNETQSDRATSRASRPKGCYFYATNVLKFLYVTYHAMYVLKFPLRSTLSPTHLTSVELLSDF